MAKIKKAQFGKLIGNIAKSAIKSGTKSLEKSGVKKIEDSEIKNAFRSMERDRMKKMFQKIDAEEAAKKAPKQKMGGKIKKAQAGMTMKQLIKKYPGTDTTSRGDVRGSEINSGAPKKVLQKYNDTYNAFEKKSKEAPKAKPAKKSMKTGGKMSKMSKKK